MLALYSPVNPPTPEHFGNLAREPQYIAMAEQKGSLTRQIKDSAATQRLVQEWEKAERDAARYIRNHTVKWT